MNIYRAIVSGTSHLINPSLGLSGGMEGMEISVSASKVPVGLSLVEGTAKSSSTALTKFYPANNGFLGATERIFLMLGEQISRYGSASGKFFSPAGTPLPMRALPTGSNTSIFNTYKVLKPFEVQAGKITPAFLSRV